MAVWTVGHSTRPLQEFLVLLGGYGLEAIAYRWLPSPGGRRRARPDSPNTAWRNPSFRGYSDHIETEEFGRGLEELLELSARLRTAIMYAEAPWWRCHRALIADVLRARGTAYRIPIPQRRKSSTDG